MIEKLKQEIEAVKIDVEMLREQYGELPEEYEAELLKKEKNYLTGLWYEMSTIYRQHKS